MLYLIATPIGNLEDISLRALRILKEVDLVLAEDTRKTGFLLSHYQIKKPINNFHDHNELAKIPSIIEELKEGKNIALVSDAGTPTISDPGYKLLRACRQEKITFTSIPGPSSVINSLALSTVPRDKFLFIGYIPRKDNERKKIFQGLVNWDSAIAFFESPFRINKTLLTIKEVFGNRIVTITREMTKKFEEVIECPVEEAISIFTNKKPQGEFTVVIDNRRDQ